MRPDAPYFIILLCLTPDDFSRQGESVATQWVNDPPEILEVCRIPQQRNAICLQTRHETLET